MSNVVIAIPLFMLMIIVALLPLLIGVYVYRDAKRRGMNAALWTLIAILAPSLIGFIIYLLVRGNYSNLKCPRCAATVTEQYVVCPKCGAKLKPSCPNCSAPVEPDWTVCPKCAQPLPTVQEDIVTPVQPKDKTLWKILAAIIIVPVVLLLVLGLSFSAASGGGSSSLREVSFDEYYADQELPESTKEYVRNWLGEINPRTDHVYALRYTYRFNPNSETTDYYYLIYVPGGGDVDRRGFGYSTGLFSTAFKLELEGTNDQDGLYCVMTTSKKAAPQLRVTLNGKRLEDEITVVDFNPTLYTIASESDYSKGNDDCELFADKVDYTRHLPTDIYYDEPRPSAELFWKYPQYHFQSEVRVAILNTNFVWDYDPQHFKYEQHRLDVYLPHLHEYATIRAAKDLQNICFFCRSEDEPVMCAVNLPYQEEK